MGTPDFAVASLDALVKAGFDIVGVVTAPDKPAGRGQKLNESAVKKYAIKKGLTVLQPAKLKDPDFIKELRSLNADLQLVIAFRMLPEAVWQMPPKGTINLHGSLLPQYRGAAPINWAIINGEKESGVTTFFLKHEIDTGDILFTEKVNIGEHETAGDLHDKLMIVGAELLVKTVKAIETGEFKEIPQSETGSPKSKVQSPKSEVQSLESGLESPDRLHHAPKLFKEDCELVWDNTVTTIYNRIRGLSPYPTAYTFLQGKLLKIFNAEPEFTEPGINTGEFLTDHKTYLKYACRDGLISVTDVQYEGKKRMQVADFLRGIRLKGLNTD